MGAGKTEVGRHYRLAWHDGLCLGPLDAYCGLEAATKMVWQGRITASSAIDISEPQLWGGEKDQGGVEGRLRLMFGEATQLPNVYLTSIFGDQTVAWRGIATVAWEGGRWGANNPYQGKRCHLVERIKAGWDNDECWYPETAAIPLGDAGSGSAAYDILITGSTAVGGTAVFAVAKTGVAPVPVAIPASTGADEGGMVGAYHDGKWVAASQYGTRVLDGPLSTTASWTTGTLTGAARTVEFVGASDDGEWAAKDWTIASSGSTSFNTILAGDPSSMSAVTTSGTNSLGAAFTMRHQLLRFVGGYWYSAQARGIFRSPTLSETFTAVWDEYDSAGAGWDPNGATIIGFYDVVKSGSDTYFIVRWHFNDALVRIRIWRSPDGGFTMDEANIEWDQDGTDSPRQLIEIGGKIVALCSNFDVITNANGPFQRVSTGIPIFPEVGGALRLDQWEAPKIATDGERVYIVGGSYMVVSADKGVTWGDPILLPISNAKSIAIGISSAVPGTARYVKNPAHIILEAHTASYHAGQPMESLNLASFEAAADWYYAQGFGLGTARRPDKESPEEYIRRIERVAGCSFSQSNEDGLWYIDIANGEYDLESLPVLTDDDIIEFEEVPSVLDTAINSVSVKYFDPLRKEAITTRPLQAIGLIAEFGENHQTFDFQEIPSDPIAARVRQREGLATTTPTRAFNLVTTPKTRSWRKSTYFRLQSPKRGIADMVCIVAEGDEGRLASGNCQFKATQDIYSLPSVVYETAEPGVDTRPPETPVPIEAQRLVEAPYIDVVSRFTPTEFAALAPDVGFAVGMAANPGGMLDFTLAIDAGAGYQARATGDYCPSCTASAEVLPGQQTGIAIANADQLEAVEVDTLCLWDNELCRVDAIDLEAGTIDLGRGCGHSIPALHLAGSRLFFYQAGAAADSTEYTDGETIDGKLLSNTGTKRLALADADALPLTFNRRLARPYPPASVTLNGSPIFEVGTGGGGGGGGGSAPSIPPALDKYGNPASSSPGPNGGFADNAPDPLPQPEVFGTDVIGSDGEFGDPGALANWRNNDGSALSAEWSIDSGRLRYHGRSTYAIAVHWPSRMRMAIQPSAGAIVSVAASVQTDGFGPPAGGSPVGATIGADRTAVQVAASYPVATDVTYSHDYQIDVPGVTAYGVYNLPAATPCVAVYNPAGDLVTCWWDDFTAEVSDPDVPMTAFVPANIDFPGDDLTGWVTFAGLMDEDIAGGELLATCTDAAGSTRYYINTDEIPVTDVGQRIRVRAEVWSNDTTTTLAGTDRITANGVALGIALRDSVGNYYYSQYAYVFQRGDWTQREWWQEVTTISGMTYHALFAVRAGEGFAGGIRDIEIDYTTDPVTR